MANNEKKNEMYPHGGSRYRNVLRRNTCITRAVIKKHKSGEGKEK